MKIYLVAISLFITLTVFGQQTMPDDSGFTNKSEAKNELKDSLKEGKWIEYYADDKPSIKGKWANNYRLTIYRHGKPIGIVRNYFVPGDALTWIYPYNKDGQLDGLVKKYTQNGIFYSGIPYVNGKRNGTFIEYDVRGYDIQVLGVLIKEYQYKDDKFEGVSKDYYEGTGILKSLRSYSDNMLNGVSKEFDADGKIKSVSFYKDGKLTGVKKEYYANWKTKNDTILKNGKQKIIPAKYDYDSSLMSETHYTDGLVNGMTKEYYANGQLIKKTLYIEGQPNGNVKEYYGNGRLKSDITYHNGKQDGVSKEYFDNDTLKSEMSYSEGKFNGVSKEYYKSGRVKNEKNYSYDRFNGEVKEYFENGFLKRETIYINGTANGIWKDYYESGELMRESPFNYHEKIENQPILIDSITKKPLLSKSQVLGLLLGQWEANTNYDKIRFDSFRC